MIDALVSPIGTGAGLISLQELSLERHGAVLPGRRQLPGVLQWMIRIKMQRAGGE